MARKLGGGNAFGGAVGGGTSAPPTGGTLPSGQQSAPQLSKKQQSKITHGVHGDPNNPFNTGISGNITSGQGSFVANENPDDYWTWLGMKAHLNQDPRSPFGKWMSAENTYLQSLYGAAKQDNPNLYFSNWLGQYGGFGSPTQPDPKAEKLNGGGAGGGNNHNNNQQQNNNDNNGPHHKKNSGGRKRGNPQRQSPPPAGSGQ